MQWSWAFKAGLDYGEEMQQSRVLRGWSNMIGYETCSSLTKIYDTAKNSLMKYSSMNEKMTWLLT